MTQRPLMPGDSERGWSTYVEGGIKVLRAMHETFGFCEVSLVEEEGGHGLLHHTAVPKGGQLASDEGFDELLVIGLTGVCSELGHELRGQLLVEDQFGCDGEDPQFLELIIVKGRRLTERISNVLGVEGRRWLLGRYDLWFGPLDGVI